MEATRLLVVVADDYGIGPETSRGILELAAQGVVGAAVLLVNSPYAGEAVRAWRQSGVPLELGWHPCLTLDQPAAGPRRVPSLVGPDGCLWPLPRFLARLALGIEDSLLGPDEDASAHQPPELGAVRSSQPSNDSPVMRS